MARIDALFKMMKEQGASDLHLSTGNPPIFRLHGEMDGQVFALAVMAVAAAEVCVGLGLIVAISRRRLALDVDAFAELKG